MIQIELIYDADCPAADEARKNLRGALLGAKLPARWTEWDRSSPATPDSMRAFGSPTILVNARDIAGAKAAGAASCRIYQSQPGRLAAIPPLELIAAALSEADIIEGPAAACALAAKWIGAAAIPAALASILPVLGCPLCWPAYAAILSSLGLGFLASARYLLPLAIALLAGALAALGVQARRRGYAPLVVGVVASGVIVLGKFELASTATTYAGVLPAAGRIDVELAPRSPYAFGPCPDCVAPRPHVEPSDRPASGA